MNYKVYEGTITAATSPIIINVEADMPSIKEVRCATLDNRCSFNTSMLDTGIAPEDFNGEFNVIAGDPVTIPACVVRVSVMHQGVDAYYRIITIGH